MLFRLSKTRKITGNIFVVKTLISNFFIYSDGNINICFDAGFMPSVVNRELKKIKIKPESVSGIFLTCTSFHHIGGIRAFKNARVYLSEDISSSKSKRIVEYIDKKIKLKYSKLKDGEIIELGNIKIKSFVIPNHSSGSMSYIVNNTILFI